MTYKTGQMTVHASVHPCVCPCGVNIFKNPMLPHRWADVGDTWHVYSVARGTTYRQRNFEFQPGAARATWNLPGHSTNLVNKQAMNIYRHKRNCLVSVRM